MIPSTASLYMKAAAPLRQKVSRIDQRTAEKLFPLQQRQQWPPGYLPASGVAHLLHPQGIPFHEVVECYQDIAHDRHHALQRDFAADYALWNRCTLHDFVRRLGAAQRRRFTRITARDRLVPDADVRALFQLAPYAPPLRAQGAQSRDQVEDSLTRRAPSGHHDHDLRGSSSRCVGGSSTASGVAFVKATAAALEGSTPEKEETQVYYGFQPYAAIQDYAMLPVRAVRSPEQLVCFTTFPQIHNVLHTTFDSMTALRALSLYSEDGIFYTREMVQAVALYLQRRLEEVAETEAVVLPAVATASSSSSDSSGGVSPPTYAAESPILVFFGNGRLAWMLNDSGLLPKTVRAVQLPWQDAQRRRRHNRLLPQQESLAEEWGLHRSFATVFPCETLSVGDALRKYRPAIALVEPHVDRDYLCDLRGFYSVREVLVMGPIDSPAMGSFSHPFLSFGVLPGPSSYWVYNEHLHKVRASERVRMPMDPPHELQGYKRHYVDDISACLLSPNDCSAIGCQHRCLAFRRVRPPVVRNCVAEAAAVATHAGAP